MKQDPNTFVQMYLKTYGQGSPITVGQFHEAIKVQNLDFKDDNTGQQIRKIIKDIEVMEHKLTVPNYCFGSTTEGFLVCKNRDQASESARYLLSKFISIAIRYQLRKTTMNKLFPLDEFSTPLFKDQDPLPDMDLEKLYAIERISKLKGDIV